MSLLLEAPKIILDVGEVYCVKCKGDQVIFVNGSKQLCPKCFGVGKLDWITNAMGIPKDIDGFSGAASSGTLNIPFGYNSLSSGHNNITVVHGANFSTNTCLQQQGLSNLLSPPSKRIINSIKNRLLQVGKILFRNKN